MSSITELEFIQLLHQTRVRLFSNPNSSFHPPQLSSLDGEDQGLVMKLDQQQSFIRAPVNLSTESEKVSSIAISASILESIPHGLLKKLYQLKDDVEKEWTRLLPFLLYLSLLVLGLQALMVVFLLFSAPLSVGVFFLLICSVILGSVFLFSTGSELKYQPTPPPTPSHSSASLSTFAST